MSNYKGNTKKSTGNARGAKKEAAGKTKRKSSGLGSKKMNDRAKTANNSKKNEGIPMSNEIGLVTSFGVMFIIMLSNFGYCGTAGNWLSNFFFGIFGCVQYVMPIVFFLAVAILIVNDYSLLALKKCGAGFVTLMMISAFVQLLYQGKNITVHNLFSIAIEDHWTGGIIGGGIGLCLKNWFGTAGAMVIIFCILLLSLVLLTQRSFVGFFETSVGNGKAFAGKTKEKYQILKKKRQQEIKQKKNEQKKQIQKEPEEQKASVVQLEGTEEIGKDRHPFSFLKMKNGKKKKPASADKLRAKQCEEKVRELEEKKSQTKAATPEQKISEIHINLPVFTSSDEVKRKDCVKELHPKIYPFTAEDAKPQEFDGTLDFSAFSFNSGKTPEEFQEEIYSRAKTVEEQKKEKDSFVPPYKSKGPFVVSELSAREEYTEKESYREDAPEERRVFDSEIIEEETLPTSVFPEEIRASCAVTLGGCGVKEQPIENMHPARNPQEEAQEEIWEDSQEEAQKETWEDPQEEAKKETWEDSQEENQEDLQEENQEKLQWSKKEYTEKISKPEEVWGNSQQLEKNKKRDTDKSKDPEKYITSTEKFQDYQRAAAPAKKTKISVRKPAAKKDYLFPPVSLLIQEHQEISPDYDKQLRETALKLQQTLDSFGVKVTITDISCGPTVTRYEMFPEQGTKVSKILSLTDDIKLNLAASDIRIEAPIPGKAAVGIEVPNKHNMTVHFRELVDNPVFRKFKSRLAFAVGKDIGGKIVVTDLAKMPHLLIAGATGSGKSVCINTLIMSILYKASPEEVKLIMIDPKMVELSTYNGIPHLLIPVVTDPKKASGALNWAVAEMTDRYKKFTETSVRNIEGYNKKMEELIASGEVDEEKMHKMPQIVIIIDELADLMMVAPGEVEDAIVRLSQLARAAGIHLVIATQRPSVNVITGLIKANVPSRIAFSVSSGVDSRTIIDMNGAEKLLGKGDMLFYPSGYQKPVRVQGAFVSDSEVAEVVEFLKENEDVAVYDDQITKNIENKLRSNAISRERDEYFEAAARFIMEKDKATIGMLQRMFKIGFNRAARLVDQLADAGIVGPEEGTKPRKILMTPEQLEQYFEESL